MLVHSVQIKVISISSIILNGTNGCILVIKLKKEAVLQAEEGVVSQTAG